VRNSAGQGDAKVEIKDTSLDVLFEDLSQSERKQTPGQIWQQEINMYQNMPRLEGKGDPLKWWKFNEIQLPYLSIIFLLFFWVPSWSNWLGSLARKYLAIPASQASCERIFSITKNDITETRTCIKPELAQALLMLRKKKDIF
jgi:hypothetical protein